TRLVSDWSSDVCSSTFPLAENPGGPTRKPRPRAGRRQFLRNAESHVRVDGASFAGIHLSARLDFAIANSEEVAHAHQQLRARRKLDPARGAEQHESRPQDSGL